MHHVFLLRKLELRKLAEGLVIGLFMIGIMYWVINMGGHQLKSQHILAESKNTELALRLLAYDYYYRDQQIYDPLTPDGLAGGVAERIREMSGAEGTLILGSWDASRQAARSFTYIAGKFVVIYNYDEEEGSRWKLCYQFREAAKPKW